MRDWKSWLFWSRAKTFTENKMRKAWFRGGNCDSCCPRCKRWESLGNVIKTTPLEDGSDHRVCEACGHEWLAIFTPAGFIPVDCCKKQVKEVSGN